MVTALLFFILNANANYMTKDLLFDCSSPKRTTYATIEDCSKHGYCVAIPSGFDCETWEEKSGKILENATKRAEKIGRILSEKEQEKANKKEALERLKNSLNQDTRDLLIILEPITNRIEK